MAKCGYQHSHLLDKRGSNGVGFAVPVNEAKWVASQLANGGSVRRAYLGIGIQPITAALADRFHVKPREGVVVTEVFANTPAAKAGLKSGDVITQYAGVPVKSPQELQAAVERSRSAGPTRWRLSATTSRWSSRLHRGAAG